MKYYSSLPITALLALFLIAILVHYHVIPPGGELLSLLRDSAGDYFYTLILVIILLESIVYVGFYFPGQFFAVLMVIGANPDPSDIFKLTIAMVLGASIGSIINYEIGRRTSTSDIKNRDLDPIKFNSLLIAMIHINSLAFFMVNQGAANRSRKIIGLAGILNLPYYLLLIFATATLSEEVMQLAENSTFLISVVVIWLIIALYMDVRKYRQT